MPTDRPTAPAVRPFAPQDLPQMTALWNDVVAAGCYFPQKVPLAAAEAGDFFAAQSFTGVAELNGRVVGLYILHPNGIGHCAVTANASYAVDAGCRGQHLGELLVRHSLQKARELGFVGLQFNAVVCTNAPAISLYKKLGFTQLGTCKNGYRLNDGRCVDLLLFHHPL